MWTQFLLTNAHFALNIFGGLTMFGICWLYFDAWTARRQPKEGIRSAGFLLLAASFIIHATQVESNILQGSVFFLPVLPALFFSFRIASYILIIISLFLDPIQPRPIYEQQNRSLAALPALPALTNAIFYAAIPFLAIITGSMYFRRATTGLERHLKPVAIGFLLLSASELLSLRDLFLNSQNVDIFTLMLPFGPVWIVEHLLLFAAMAILNRWVFGYLLKRFETQLFMINVTTIIIIFLVTAVSFTSLLVKNLIDETLANLETNAKVLAFALDSKKAEVVSYAQVVAQDKRIIDGISSDRRSLAQLANELLLAKKTSALFILDTKGTVLADGENIENWGKSYSDDPLVKKASAGVASSAFLKKSGTLADSIIIQGAHPIIKDENNIGTVIVGSIIDTALLDGIKKATGLESSLWAQSILSATTVLANDSTTRPIGIAETNTQVATWVLKRGLPFTGPTNLLSTAYYASYLPIKDIQNNPIGMLSVGKPQHALLVTAGKSIQLTFLATVVLLVLSLFPAYAVSRFIVKQIR